MNRNRNTVIVTHETTLNQSPTESVKSQSRSMAIQAYLCTYWMDYVMMAIMGGLALGIHFLGPMPNHIFPVYHANGEIVNPEYSYPHEKNIIPIWLAALLAFLIPFLFILLMQIYLRDFHDANAAIMGLLYSLISAAVVQVFMKWLIGGLRPHFFSVCKPSINSSDYGMGDGFDGILFDRTICTGDERQISHALQSMPSGHSTAIFAGFVYFSLYLNGKLKIFANYRPQYWKFILFFLPLFGATLISLSLTVDHYHHWYDVVIGSLIGIIFAFSSYRFQYASIWNYRFNHIPLPRTDGDEGFDYEFEHTSNVSKARGWPNENAYRSSYDATGTLSILKSSQSRISDVRL